MAYTKTQWVNNTTPINDTNLNKIEQGIYDNSLVVDAVTNTLNPTDTETYKTAELTEGQITDVIGVSDIVIKGDTEQDGTPTPSAPVDINVVSGSNVIDIQNSDTNFAKEPVLINYNVNNDGLGTSNGYAVSQKIFVNNETKFYYGLNTAFSNVNDSTLRIGFFDENDNFLSRVLGANIATSPIRNVTIPNNTKYIMIGASNNASNGFWREIEKVYYGFSSTIVPHQGKELPLDLPVENLFDKNNITDGQFINADGTLSSSVNYVTTDFIPITPNTKYYLPKTSTRRLKYFNSNKQVLSSSDWDIASSTSGQVLTTPANAYYVRFSIDKAQNDINTFQFEQGSKANAYTPYGTTPIELCKIGNYQDYFYKSGSKWYLHKEVGKVVLNGSEEWSFINNCLQSTNELPNNIISIDANLNALSNYFVYHYYPTGITGNMQVGEFGWNSSKKITFKIENLTTKQAYLNWLALNNTTVYYPLATATGTEITDTTLISQLEAIYNAPLYEQTNITQTNNDLPMVLDITACKDNINGIKAFIRK